MSPRRHGLAPATDQGTYVTVVRSGTVHIEVRLLYERSASSASMCRHPLVDVLPTVAKASVRSLHGQDGAGGPQFLVPLRDMRGGQHGVGQRDAGHRARVEWISVWYSSSTMARASEASRMGPPMDGRTASMHAKAGKGFSAKAGSVAVEVLGAGDHVRRPLRTVDVARACLPRRGIDGLAESRRTLGQRRALDGCGGRSRRRPGRPQVQLTTVRGSVNPMMKDTVVRLPALASTACTKAPLKA